MTTILAQAADRKEMVKAISEHLGIPAVYLRTPTYAFQIGELTVNRDSSITGEQEALMCIEQFLLDKGFIADRIALDIEAQAEEQPAETEDDLEAPEQTEDTEQPNRTCISVPLTEFTPLSMANLLRLLYARQYLIREMTRSATPILDEEIVTRLKDEHADSMDAIQKILRESADIGMAKGITIDEDRLNIEFSYRPEQPTEWTSYATLLFAIANRAKQAHHVSVELLQPEDSEMKYFARCWLMQLGLGGAEHKDLRGILLNHLHGYAAFRSADQMQKHQEKYAALRRQQREETQQPAADLEAHAEIEKEAAAE